MIRLKNNRFHFDQKLNKIGGWVVFEEKVEIFKCLSSFSKILNSIGPSNNYSLQILVACKASVIQGVRRQ